MTVYYTFTGVPIAGSRGVSSLFRTELTSIQTGFATVNTEMVLKAPIASPTFTGIPAGPTAAAGTSTTQLATTAFVAATAFTSALPAQAGNDGKVITTDGTTASWTASLKATIMRWVDGADTTKKLAFNLAGFTTGTTRTLTPPDADGTILTTAAAVTVPQGGTGAGTFTDGGVMIGNGTGTMQVTSAGTAGQVLTSNGTGVDPTFQAAGVGDHEVLVTTGNGFGSSSTKIRRFTTTQTNVGTAITYADSATLGATFTINETGLYAIRYSDVSDGTANVQFGVTLNSAQLTTDISSVTASTRLLWNIIATAASFMSDSVVVKLTAGDVVRAHGVITLGDTSAVTRFSIRKVGKV